MTANTLTLAAIAGVLALVLFSGANVGMAAFIGAILLTFTRIADEKRAIQQMPWRVIMMVSGVTVLIARLERAQGIDLLVSLVARFSTAETVTAVVAFLTGIISVYSSTSGVVLPAFLPMVPGLAQPLGGVDPVAIAARPAAMIPRPHHQHVRRGGLVALDILERLQRPEEVLGVEPAADGQHRRLDVLQMRSQVARFPEVVVIRLCVVAVHRLLRAVARGHPHRQLLRIVQPVLIGRRDHPVGEHEVGRRVADFRRRVGSSVSWR